MAMGYCFLSLSWVLFLFVRIEGEMLGKAEPRYLIAHLASGNNMTISWTEQQIKGQHLLNDLEQN